MKSNEDRMESRSKNRDVLTILTPKTPTESSKEFGVQTDWTVEGPPGVPPPGIPRRPPHLTLLRRHSTVLRSLESPKEVTPKSPHLHFEKSKFNRTATDILRQALSCVRKNLDLSNHILGDDNVRALCKTMDAGKSKIMFLDLKGNHIGRVAARSIAKMLVRNKNLLVLKMGTNNLKDIGVEMISRSLGVNTTLRTLKLNRNGITDSGAQAIGNMLCSSKSLDSLYLGHNDITDAGCMLILRALYFNTTLKSLYLNGNIGITDKSATEALKILPYNQTMHLFRVDGCSISEKGLTLLGNAEKKSRENGGNLMILGSYKESR
eukprot:g2586.t1